MNQKMKNIFRKTVLATSIALPLTIITPKVEAKLGADFQAYEAKVAEIADVKKEEFGYVDAKKRNLPEDVDTANAEITKLSQLKNAGTQFYEQVETTDEKNTVEQIMIVANDRIKDICEKFDKVNGMRYDHVSNRILRKGELTEYEKQMTSVNKVMSCIIGILALCMIILHSIVEQTEKTKGAQLPADKQ